jgi:hypothetical protein
MTLINNADPYQAGPLPDSSEDIAHLIEDTVGGGKFAKEMASLSGTWYSKFVHEINNVKEQKDSDLAQIMVCFLDLFFGLYEIWALQCITIFYPFLVFTDRGIVFRRTVTKTASSDTVASTISESTLPRKSSTNSLALCVSASCKVSPASGPASCARRSNSILPIQMPFYSTPISSASPTPPALVESMATARLVTPVTGLTWTSWATALSRN